MKNLKSFEDYKKEHELQNYRKRFTELVNYNNKVYKIGSEKESDLYLILDQDDDCVNSLPILEYETYKRFFPTKKTYRIDKGNNAIGQQEHAHVYADKKHNHQLYAINIDGTPHDGSKYKLSTKDQEALRNIGFNVPTDGLLEWLDKGVLLTD